MSKAINGTIHHMVNVAAVLIYDTRIRIFYEYLFYIHTKGYVFFNFNKCITLNFYVVYKLEMLHRPQNITSYYTVR